MMFKYAKEADTSVFLHDRRYPHVKYVSYQLFRLH